MHIEDIRKNLEALFPGQIESSPDALIHYGKDWTKHIEPNPSTVFFPRDTAQVQQLVIWARKNKISLVPSGGRTGLSGGAIATNGEVVVSFDKMNRLLDFDPFDQTVTCEPGVITEQLQNFALEKRLYFPVDFASRGSSQIGGNIATNAGGIKVLKYGLFRQWVSGLQVVTGAGDILELNNALVKNATGYDLRQLFIGSEGTLGFITRATMQLTRQPKELSVFLFAVPHLFAVMKLFHLFKSQTSLSAFEMFTEEALEVVLKHTGLHRPLSEPSPYYIVVEVEKENDNDELSTSLFEKALQEEWVTDGLLAQTPQQAREFWRMREDISEATAAFKPYKNDISVRISKVPEFLAETDQLLKKNYPHFKVVWFGHIGDGNLHINILKPEGMDSVQFLSECKKVDQQLFSVIQKMGGSISAEHGVGLTKKAYLEFTRTSSEIELMKKIKRQFDPDGILNPGKIFDL